MEEWRDIKSYEGLYQISNLARIKSSERIALTNKYTTYLKPEKILSESIGRGGYRRVNLSKNSKKKTFAVHRLVYEAFNGPIPENLVVDHKDNNKLNNISTNLQTITTRLNSSKDKKNGVSKYTGVSKYKSDKKWTARIFTNGQKIYLGSFDIEEDARDAYQNKLTEINR